MNAGYGPAHVDPATRTASVLVASSWSASSTSARSIAGPNVGHGVGPPHRGQPPAEPAVDRRRPSASPSTAGTTPSSRRAAAAGSSSGWCTPSAPATAAIVATPGRPPTALATRRARPTSAGRGAGHVTAGRQRPRPQQLGHLLVRARAGQLGDVVAAVAHAVLVERRHAGDDLHVERRPRLALPPAHPRRQRVDVVGRVQRRAPVDGDPPADQPPADVGVQRRLLHPEHPGRLGRTDEPRHGRDRSARINVDRINVDRQRATAGAWTS